MTGLRPIALLGLAGLIGLSGCASAPATTGETVQPAILSDVSDSRTRTLIRVHVRDGLGSGYLADIDALATSDRMMARDNGRSQARGARLPLPNRIFRLEILRTADGVVCRLVSDPPDINALILPPDIGCEPAV